MSVKLSPYNPKWVTLFQEEKKILLETFGDSILDVEHIGSTAIPNMISKPIIDIAVMLSSFDNAESLIEPLKDLGYNYDKSASSSERYFFRKGEPTEYHLSLTVPHVSFWYRQIVFRDYLTSNPAIAKEYKKLKIEMIEKDPTGRKDYLNAKSPFVQKVLLLAEK